MRVAALLLIVLQQATASFLAPARPTTFPRMRAPPSRMAAVRQVCERPLLLPRCSSIIDEVRCSACSQVDTAEFEEAIQDCSTPIVVDIYAVWCGPCQLMAPQLEEVAQKYGGDRVRFLKVDSDEEPEVANVLKIAGLPTTLFISDMSVVGRAEGMLMAKELEELCEHHFFDGPAPEIMGGT